MNATVTSFWTACPFCKDSVTYSNVTCQKCGTTHHFQCWLQHGRCSVYGCGGVTLSERIPGYKKNAKVARLSLILSLCSYVPFLLMLVSSLPIDDSFAITFHIAATSLATILALIACQLRIRKPTQYGGEWWYTISICAGFYVAAATLIGYLVSRGTYSLLKYAYLRWIRPRLVRNFPGGEICAKYS